MLLYSVFLSALATLSLAASPTPPCGAGPDPQGEVIKATWIAPQNFPNCGFAGVSCGAELGTGKGPKYYCAPFKSTCCIKGGLGWGRRGMRRQIQDELARAQAEADKQVEDMSAGRTSADKEAKDPATEPIFGKPDGKRSYCPDGYDCVDGGKWCKRRPGATINTNRPGKIKPTATLLPYNGA